MNFKALKSNPSVISFSINSSSGMQSKAFYKSANKAPKVSLLSTLFFHFSTIAIRQRWTLMSLLKPHWYFERVTRKKIEI